jgi:hypothetical protein
MTAPTERTTVNNLNCFGDLRNAIRGLDAAVEAIEAKFDAHVDATTKMLAHECAARESKCVEVIHALQSELKHLRATVTRYEHGELTDAELQNICHNLPPERAKAFYDGCDEQQRKLTGRCRTDELSAEVAQLQAYIRILHPAAKRYAELTPDETRGYARLFEAVQATGDIASGKPPSEVVERAKPSTAESIHELEEMVSSQEAVLQAKVAELIRLRTFKATVHTMLDSMSVPTMPDAECRVKARLTHVANELTKLRGEAAKRARDQETT